jgi:FkbM family methyltransferase
MNYFIDCGTHFGQGIEQISSQFNFDSEWRIFTFEANPVTHRIFMDKHYRFLKEKFPYLESIHAAVSTIDGEVDMHLEIPPGEGETGQGSSIISNARWQPWGGTLNFKDEPVKVCSIDFGKWIQNLNLNPEDRMLVKLDIEGAEYDVLESMMNDGSISVVNEILIEFHHRFFANPDEMKLREDSIINELRNKNINFSLWH